MSHDVFTQLVDAHYTPLYRFALSLARREADACDLVQQTFFIWAKSGHQLRETGKAKTWLFTTLYQEFLRGRRRDLRSQAIEDLPPSAQDVRSHGDVEAFAGESSVAQVNRAQRGVAEWRRRRGSEISKNEARRGGTHD